MEILLNPSENKTSLKKYYQKAFKEGTEILIVSAYLTNWDEITLLNKKCKEFCLIVGKDFGITRKKACYDVLKWLPKNFKSDFLSADFTSGFHPKVIIWKTDKNKQFCIIGSSNLTEAAFTSNYEANVYLELNNSDYKKIKEWIFEIKRYSSPISNDWIQNYNESKYAARGKGNKTPRVIELKLPYMKSMQQAVVHKKRQQSNFQKIKNRATILINNCAAKKVTNLQFYNEFSELWNNSDSRFQGRGFEILGKHSRWSEVCTSLVKIISSSKEKISLPELDSLVKNEMDFLAKKGNPTRKSWLSEMLCHYFPDKYPVINDPVKRWLKFNKFRGPVGASEGAKYIDLSIKMRQLINGDQLKIAVKNLAELDGAIFEWSLYHEN